MSREPLITIGIPVYNEEKFLKDTIQSVLDQTNTNLVLNISDNCSTDKTAEIIKEFLAIDPRIKYHRQNKLQSPIDNFAYLKNNCQTKYFMWLGGHDLLQPHFIDEAISTLENNGKCSLFYPRTQRIDRDKNLLPIPDFEIDTEHLDVYDRIIKVFRNLVSSSLLHGVFRTEQLKKIPFTNDGHEEYFIFLKSCVNGSFIPSKQIGLLRREIRHTETPEEIEKRYTQYGFKYTSRYSYFNYISFVLIETIFEIKGLSYKQQCKLLTNIKYFFIDAISSISYNQIIYYFLYKKFNLKVVLASILKKFHIFIKS